jgi:hypothetical protein
VSAINPAPVRAAVPLPRADNIWFGVVLAAQAIYLLTAVWHLLRIQNLADHADAFTDGTGPALLELVDRANDVETSVHVLSGVSVVAVVLFGIWLRRTNGWFEDAGEARGYRKLLAFKVYLVAMLAWLIVVFVHTPRAVDSPTADAVRAYTHDVTINVFIRMGIALVLVWCAYSVWNAARHLPVTSNTPPPVGIVG